MPESQIEIIDQIMSKPEIIEGFGSELSPQASAKLLAELLFEITNRTGTKLVEVRDRETIRKKGTFRYSGQADTMHEEGLMPHDVYEGLEKIGIDRHVGPSYLRVKGLLTHHDVRRLFGRQMAFAIKSYLEEHPLEKDGYLVIVPNMTGGVWIGDETAKQAREVLGDKVWPVTPYARETRKAIEAIDKGARFSDCVEGLMPSPEETAAVFCFEELRTSAETTQNATNIYRRLGHYDSDNGVRIVEGCVFDYRHPVGVERLRRLQTDALYLVEGVPFFNEAQSMGYISGGQNETVGYWLRDPWSFTREILPDLAALAGTR
ncbi:MAG: hypothetical protein HY513_03895 [Candidatus Aenigmarchaeota archaeon]|nr:hypothetical protein [Candidatus Aenigmarchaeota archaeon]